ncbi:MAG: hypothetical protein ACTHLE_07250 [Agriterribacter sp.]
MITYYKGFKIEANKLENEFVSAVLRDKDGNLIKADTLKDMLPNAVFNLKLLVDKITKTEERSIAA